MGNRPISAYIRNFREIPFFVWYFVRAIYIFKYPIAFFGSYLKRVSPPNNTIRLRNGMFISLTSHPHDILGVFDIFLRQSYGNAPYVNSTIIDIGANVGAFSLYAALNGAKKVYAYEPNTESYLALQRNVQGNDLGHVINPYKFALTSKANDLVKFPLRPSMYNSIISSQNNGTDVESEFEYIKTITLNSILEKEPVIDILKLDCEGSESEILAATDSELLKGVRQIRMEYHGNLDQIVYRLEHIGYVVTHIDRYHSIIWFDRSMD